MEGHKNGNGVWKGMEGHQFAGHAGHAGHRALPYHIRVLKGMEGHKKCNGVWKSMEGHQYIYKRGIF